MFRILFLGAVLLPALSVQAASLRGVWTSDCQNVGNRARGFLSRRPVDTFSAGGRATLRVHVFEGLNCKGKEWDEAILSCTYRVGRFVPGLAHTRELDLLCNLQGQLNRWYEIAEVRPTTLRFGNQTGTTPKTRPKSLGSVYYRR